MQYALADYGADHVKALHDPVFEDENSWGLKELKGLGIKPVESIDISSEKVKLFKISDFFWSLMSILGICVFFFGPSTSIGSLDDLIEIIYSITGWKTTWYELMQVAERYINMARILT
jgi:aldehyde:ferredoxin oxidoreductase